jgi:hypothetical protein
LLGRVQKIDYLELPCPVKYEELQREALSAFPDNHCDSRHLGHHVPLTLTKNRWGAQCRSSRTCSRAAALTSRGR